MVTQVETRRAFTYGRVSTERQSGERHVSLAVQRERADDYIRRNGLLHVGNFVDVASGRRDKRAEYQRMVGLALEGGCDVVVVQFLDRFGRNPREILRRVWELQEANVAVEAVEEDIKQELMLLIKAGFAGQESLRNGERTRHAMKAAAKNKGTKFGRDPYGVKGIREVGKDGRAWRASWEIVPSEAAIVREMVRLAIEENLGYAAIVNALTAKGMLNRSEMAWNTMGVRAVLTSEHIIGTHVFGRRSASKEIERNEGMYPAIISVENWNKLQARLEFRRGHSRGRTHVSHFLLSGLLRCGHCGGAMTGRTRSANGKEYRYYRCVLKAHSVPRCPDSGTHNAGKLEQAVLDFLGTLSDEAKVRAYLAKHDGNEAKAQERELREATNRVGKLGTELDRLLDRLAAGTIDDDEYRQAADKRKAEKAQLEERQAALEIKVGAQRNQARLEQELPAIIASFTESVQALPVPLAKGKLQQIVEAIRVTKGDIGVTFRS